MEFQQIGRENLLKELTDIGIAFALEQDYVRLLELIVTKAQIITHADGGILYIRTEDNRLKMEVMLINSLNLHLGGTSSLKIEQAPLNLYNADSIPNADIVATYSAINGKTINIDDTYHDKQFDFSSSYQFDQSNNYYSQSFLTIPMINHLNEVIGVLQLINAVDQSTGATVSFSSLDQQIVESLASQAAIAINKNGLIQAHKHLFDVLVQLIANSIDEKSPYNSDHCRRVPILTNMIADAICKTTNGPLKDFQLSADEKYELEVAAWLHDFGKITVPEYVVNKATKLETIFDRVHLINARFEIIKRDAHIALLEDKLCSFTDATYILDSEYLEKLTIWQEFIRQCNLGSEELDPEKIAVIEKIAHLTWMDQSGELQRLLSDEEMDCLKIERGTLTIRERKIINNHVSVSIKMLNSLPYPKNLKNVAAYAGTHHEKMDGSGYPLGLKGDEIPIQGRIIAIADIFEALTASDKPYKKTISLSKALDILAQMKQDGHIDGDIYNIFMEQKVYQQYADQYL